MIEIKDFEPHIVKAMIKYLYTNKISDAFENVNDIVNLVKIADKYDLGELIKVCETRIIINTFSSDNLIDLCQLAKLLNLGELKASVILYLIDNLSTVSRKDVWIELCKSFPEITTVVMARRMNVPYYSD